MEPRIQYTQTADGVSIAFWTPAPMGRVVRAATKPRMQASIESRSQWKPLLDVHGVGSCLHSADRLGQQGRRHVASPGRGLKTSTTS